MTPYYTDDAVTLYHGDCIDVLAGCGCGDPSVGCDACGAAPHEPCRPMCIGEALHNETCHGNETEHDDADTEQ